MCPGQKCTAFWEYDSGTCSRLCYDAVVKEAIAGDRVGKKVPLDRRVNLDMRDASLGVAGKLLAEIADTEIFVPVDRIDEERTLNLQAVSLETAVRELDFMAVVRP